MKNKRLKIRIIEVFGNNTRFADELGINDQTVSRVITGRKFLDQEEKEAWSGLLKCEVEEIF